VPIREIRGFDEAKVRVGEGADANTRGRVCSPEFQADTVPSSQTPCPVRSRDAISLAAPKNGDYDSRSRLSGCRSYRTICTL